MIWCLPRAVKKNIGRVGERKVLERSERQFAVEYKEQNLVANPTSPDFAPSSF
jgi:hypothetical protein